MKKILGVLLTASILCSVPVCSKAMDVNSVSESIEKSSNFVECKDGSDVLQKINLNKQINSRYSLTAAAEPNVADAYEPNNTNATASTGLVNKVIRANLGTQGDVDWYSFDVPTNDVNNKVYAFILDNIPAGCDYDLIAISGDGSQAAYNIQQGNTPESFYVKLPKAGKWYVVVQSKGQYSASNYRLYFGNAYYKTSTTVNPNIKYNFGYYDVDHSQVSNVHAHKTSDKFLLDLSNVNFIPEQSVTTGISVTSDGNGGIWRGLTKYVQIGSDVYSCQYGTGIDYINIESYKYLTKIQYKLYASVEYSSYYEWSPKICLDYVFPVTSNNLRFLS